MIPAGKPRKDLKMKKSAVITLICGILAVLFLGVSMGSCSGSGGKVYHTMFEGTSASPDPETVIVTVPVSVIVTVPVEPSTLAPVSDHPVSTDAPATADAKTTEEATTAEPVEVLNFDYEIVTEEKNIGGQSGGSSKMILRYPKISGLSNEKTETKVNSLLGQIAEAKCNAKNSGSSDKVGIVIEVTKSEVTFINANIMSVRNEGKVSFTDGSAGEEFVFCNVINLSTGKDIAPKNVYTTEGFAKVMELFKSGAFTGVRTNADMEKNVTKAEMMAPYKDYETYSSNYPPTYFTDKALVICVAAEAGYGYWAEYSVPLDKVSDCFRISPLS